MKALELVTGSTSDIIKQLVQPIDDHGEHILYQTLSYSLTSLLPEKVLPVVSVPTEMLWLKLTQIKTIRRKSPHR